MSEKLYDLVKTIEELNKENSIYLSVFQENLEKDFKNQIGDLDPASRDFAQKLIGDINKNGIEIISWIKDRLLCFKVFAILNFNPTPSKLISNLFKEIKDHSEALSEVLTGEDKECRTYIPVSSTISNLLNIGMGLKSILYGLMRNEDFIGRLQESISESTPSKHIFDNAPLSEIFRKNHDMCIEQNIFKITLSLDEAVDICREIDPSADSEEMVEIDDKFDQCLHLISQILKLPRNDYSKCSEDKKQKLIWEISLKLQSALWAFESGLRYLINSRGIIKPHDMAPCIVDELKHFETRLGDVLIRLEYFDFDKSLRTEEHCQNPKPDASSQAIRSPNVSYSVLDSSIAGKDDQGDKGTTEPLKSSVYQSSFFKQELKNIVNIINNANKFLETNTEIPRKFLVLGDAGMGKKTFVRTVAEKIGYKLIEVDVETLTSSHKLVDAFSAATSETPSVILISGIEHVFPETSLQSGRSDILFELLHQIEAIPNTNKVLLFATACNVEKSNQSLLNKIGLDRRIYLPGPSVSGAVSMLKIHLEKYKLEEFDLSSLSPFFNGISSANIFKISSESFLNSVLAGSECIRIEDIKNAIKKVVGKKHHILGSSESNLRKTAYHEAGHAIVLTILEGVSEVSRISIIPNERSLGRVTHAEETERVPIYLENYLNWICVGVAGRASELYFLSQVTGGSRGDVIKARNSAKRAILDLNLVPGFEFLGEYSELNPEERKRVDAKIKEILDNAHSNATEILAKHSDKVEVLVKVLLALEVVETRTLKLVLDGKTADEILSETVIVDRKKS